jgi:predicted nucleic acid-binding protein
VIAFALLPNKAIPKNLVTDALHSRRFLNRALLEDARLIVPPEFSMEVLNGFTVAMWHKLITVSTAKRAVALIKKLNLEVRAPNQNAVLELTQKMNRASASDQTYVVLALKLKCDLVTADGGLVRSALNARVSNVVHVNNHPWSL